MPPAAALVILLAAIPIALLSCGPDTSSEVEVTVSTTTGDTAPPSEVWPWLVQIGNGRAGAYSYDWLERLAGLDIHSSRRVVPELQDLRVGDLIPVENDDTWAWTWVLHQVSNGTRLLSRTRMTTRHSPLLGRLATNVFMVPASWVMERKMLLGLRQRAEGQTCLAPSG